MDQQQVFSAPIRQLDKSIHSYFTAKKQVYTQTAGNKKRR